MIIDALYRDIRFGVRRLLKDPLFTLAAVVPIALGVGVNTAMFTVGDALLRKPLADHRYRAAGGRRAVLPPTIRAAPASMTPGGVSRMSNGRDRSFERIAAYRYESRVLNRGESPAFDGGGGGFAGIFRPVGCASPSRPHFRGAQVTERRHRRAVSYGFWRDRLGSAPVIGHTIELDSPEL